MSASNAHAEIMLNFRVDSGGMLRFDSVETPGLVVDYAGNVTVKEAVRAELTFRVLSADGSSDPWRLSRFQLDSPAAPEQHGDHCDALAPPAAADYTTDSGPIDPVTGEVGIKPETTSSITLFDANAAPSEVKYTITVRNRTASAVLDPRVENKGGTTIQ